MGRDHARVRVDIWSDPDFLELTSVQQLAYLVLISSRDLSYAGVVPYVPARYALLSRDWTERKFAAALRGLEQRRFVLLDLDTAEVLVRSYVRHDGLLKQPNVAKALVRAFYRIHSEHLQDAVVGELRRLYADDPDARGWVGFREASEELFARVSAKGSRKGSVKGSPKGSATPLPPSPFPSSSSSPSVTREGASAGSAVIDGTRLLKAVDA